MTDPSTIYQESRPAGSNADEWHLFLCRYLDNRAMFPTGLTYVAVQIAEAIESRSVNEKWECSGRRQSLPEPGDCDWPNCGCDPHATKVIESLIEQGWANHRAGKSLNDEAKDYPPFDNPRDPCASQDRLPPPFDQK